MSGRLSLLLWLSPLAGASGCVTGSYQRIALNEPVLSDRLAGLRAGRDTLTTCLMALGAPVNVFEYKVAADRSSGMALLWFWGDTANWGLTFSAPVSDRASANFEYQNGAIDLPGCVLWFGPDLVLERLREGRVGDLLPERMRPSPVIDD